MRSEEHHSLGANDLETLAENLSVAEAERRIPGWAQMQSQETTGLAGRQWQPPVAATWTWRVVGSENMVVVDTPRL